MKFDKIISNLVPTVIWVFFSINLVQAQTSDIVTIDVLGQPEFGQTSIRATEAGNDITSSGNIIESQSNTWLNITSSGNINKNNHTYQVWVKAVNLPAGIALDVRRSSDGNKPGTGSVGGQVIGGSQFMAITNVPRLFFSSTGDKEYIRLMFQLRNVSVVQPTDNQGYHLVFEVVRL